MIHPQNPHTSGLGFIRIQRIHVQHVQKNENHLVLWNHMDVQSGYFLESQFIPPHSINANKAGNNGYIWNHMATMGANA